MLLPDVFGVIVLIALWAARTADIALTRNLQAGMEAQASTVQRIITSSLQNHEQTVRSNASLLQTVPSLDESQWQTYITSYNHRKEFPSLISLGVARYADDASHLNVQYVWPSDAQPSPGSNVLDQNRFRPLVDTANKNAGVVIVPDDDQPNKLLIGLPLYPSGTPVADGEVRGMAPVGYVYGELNATTMFDKIMASAALGNLDMEVFTGTSNARLYASPGFDDARGDIDLQKTYHFYSQAFRVHFRFSKLSLVNKTQLDGPLLITSGGVLAALLIASIVYLLLMSRARELQIEKAHDVDIAKDDLLSLASHQLRTPATGVKQYLGMVLQGFAGSVTERQKSLLEKAFASNDRQLAVINEVLHLAKIEAGRITLAKQDTNLGELVQDVVNEQSPDIKRAEHTVTLQLPVRPIFVYVDNHMLRMAIENVLSNAIKYTPQNGKIEVSVIGSRNYARVIIKDNGVGIAQKDLSQLFKQFTRLDNEMSYRVSGTGVGLYLVKHLVELHGGKVTVSSTPSQGSSFAITIPRRSGPQQNSKNV
jgi:signal transduction histidine kinase